MTNVTKTSD